MPARIAARASHLPTSTGDQPPSPRRNSRIVEELVYAIKSSPRDSRARASRGRYTHCREVADLDNICIEGEVAAAFASDVVVAEAWLDSGGDAPERTLVHHPFVLVTADGLRVDVEVTPEVAVVPARQISGPWREIRDHATRPRSAAVLHEDGHVKLTYGIVAVGDRVSVIGAEREHRFVPDTGGPREAPARELRSIQAIVIGVGASARRDAEARLAQARDAEQRAIERQRAQDSKRAREPERAHRRAVAARWARRAGVGALWLAGFAAIAGIGFLVSTPDRFATPSRAGASGLGLPVAGGWRRTDCTRVERSAGRSTPACASPAAVLCSRRWCPSECRSARVSPAVTWSARSRC